MQFSPAARAVCAVVFVASCCVAVAEENPPEPQAAEQPAVPAPEAKSVAPATQGLSEAQRKAVITENIVFGKDEADGFWPLYRDYRRDIAKLQDQRAKAINQYAEVFRTMTDDQAKSILQDVL